MNINWFPGHMKKTVESLKESAKLVDLIVELLDARIPYSSENPIIKDLFKHKQMITVFNKADLANETINKRWMDFYKEEGRDSFLLNSLDRLSMNALFQKIEESRISKKIPGRIRIMVVGIPNVGKSSFINTTSKRKGTKTGNRPGVTKTNQWIKTDFNVDLLDTPGVLWHKFEEQDVGVNLALTGAIKDEIMDIESLALLLINKINSINTSFLEKRYDIEVEGLEDIEILKRIGEKRGMLIKGGEIDLFKAANHVISDFRKGKIGRISLELP